MALTKISRGLLSTGISDSSDATAITIDSSENVLVGSGTSNGISGSTTGLQVAGAGFAGMISATRHDNNAYSSALMLGKSRNTTVGSNTIVQSGDEIGAIGFFADDGTNLDSQVAYIRALVDGTPGENDTPGRLTFSTTADGSAAVTERMRIDSSGNLLVGATSNAPTTTAGINLGANNKLHATRSSGTSGYFNRLSNDGGIVEFAKDGTTVGSIGANGGRPYLVNNVDGGIHVATDGYGRALLLPADQNGSPEDNLHYLGSSSYRWRDIYLSNAAYLGGTATANALDDYEEGTWTPSVNAGAISGTSISYSGTYTKIGRLVFISFVATNSAADINVSSYVQFSGVPFTIANIGTSSVMTEDPDQFDRQGFAELGSTFLTLTNSGSSSGTSTLKVGIVGSTS